MVYPVLVTLFHSFILFVYSKLKFEARNPKSETNFKFKFLIFCKLFNFIFYYFEFRYSDFEFYQGAHRPLTQFGLKFFFKFLPYVFV